MWKIINTYTYIFKDVWNTIYYNAINAFKKITIKKIKFN